MTAETLVPADAPLAVLTEINERSVGSDYADAHAGTLIPNPRPAEWFRILSTGGSERDVISDDHLIVVEAFSASETRSQRLCAFAVAWLQSAARDGNVGAVTCYGVRVVGLPQNLPMPSVPDRVRHTATISVALRRVAV